MIDEKFLTFRVLIIAIVFVIARSMMHHLLAAFLCEMLQVACFSNLAVAIIHHLRLLVDFTNWQWRQVWAISIFTSAFSGSTV